MHLRHFMFLLLEYDGSISACFQVITAAGNVKHEDIVEQAKKLFNKLSTDPTTTNMLVSKQPASFTGSEVGSTIFALYLVVLFKGLAWSSGERCLTESPGHGLKQPLRICG